MRAAVADAAIAVDGRHGIVVQRAVVVATGGVAVALAGQADIGLLVAIAATPRLAIEEWRAPLAVRAFSVVAADAALQRRGILLLHAAVAVTVAAAARRQPYVAHAVQRRHLGGDLPKGIASCVQRVEAHQLQAEIPVTRRRRGVRGKTKDGIAVTRLPRTNACNASERV